MTAEMKTNADDFIWYLVQRNFLDIGAILVFLNGDYKYNKEKEAHLKGRVEALNEYRAKLRALSPEELKALYEQEKELEASEQAADTKERQRAMMPKHWEYWRLRGSVTLIEAIALFRGHNPRPVLVEPDESDEADTVSLVLARRKGQRITLPNFDLQRITLPGFDYETQRLVDIFVSHAEAGAPFVIGFDPKDPLGSKVRPKEFVALATELGLRPCREMLRAFGSVEQRKEIEAEAKGKQTSQQANDCEAWLTDLMRTQSKEHPKSWYIEQAIKKYSVSKRAAIFAWSNALNASNSAWDKRGPVRKK